MGPADFVDQLKALGFSPSVDGDKIQFDYSVSLGRFAGQTIRLGLIVANDFPMNPPSGPHIKPRLLPQHPGNDIPHEQGGGVHESQQFGSEWQYWSRPCNHWNTTKQTVKNYMAHINHLFETLK